MSTPTSSETNFTSTAALVRDESPLGTEVSTVPSLPPFSDVIDGIFRQYITHPAASNVHLTDNEIAIIELMLNKHGYILVKAGGERTHDHIDSAIPAREAPHPVSTGLSQFQDFIAVVEAQVAVDGTADAGELEKQLVKSGILLRRLAAADDSPNYSSNTPSLQQYLMKARAAGVPIKFYEEDGKLMKVWFKGHKDLNYAMERYGPNQRTQPVQPESCSGFLSQAHTNGRNISFDVHHLIEIIQSSSRVENDVVHTPASASEVEALLLQQTPNLYNIRSGIRNFEHYLMNMRSRGAPIRFTKGIEGHPLHLFLTGNQVQVRKDRNHLTHDTVSIEFPDQAVPSDTCYWASSSQVSKHSTTPVLTLRFASLLNAITQSADPLTGFSPAQKVIYALRNTDPTIYVREGCTNMKQLLKIVRIHGLDLHWEQDSSGNVIFVKLRGYCYPEKDCVDPDNIDR